MASLTTLAGAALCRPFAQGDLDNLCGIYAALNALCIVSAPVRPFSLAESKQVFDAGVSFLQRRWWLAEGVAHGLTVKRQRAATQFMAHTAASITGLGLTAAPLTFSTQKPTAEGILQRVGERIAAGSAIIACLQNTLWHFSVFSAVSATRVQLFDSSGLHWIGKRYLGVCGGTPARHCVSLSSLIEISINGS